jgi:hypothetical protein
VFDNYIDKENFNTNLLIKNLSDIKNINLSKLKLCNSVCINESKKTDALSLMKYLQKDNQSFLKDYFDKICINDNNNDNR